MATTLRKTDSAGEYEVGKFLDKNFYPDYTENSVRVLDVDNQMAGIDIQFDYKDNLKMLVDEKASSHYVNKDIPTFAFEIDFFTSSGHLVEGWLYDKNKLTQYYLLAWLWATKDNNFKAEDITQVDILIIDRKRIIDMLAQYGLTNQKAIEISKEIRATGAWGVHHKSYDKPYYFFYSTQLAEKPLNIIIKKNKLLELALGRHIIKPK